MLERQDVGIVVRDEQAGHLQIPEHALELMPHGRASLHVQRCQRLVQEQHAGFEHERARQCHPLPLAARQSGWVFSGQSGDAQAFEHRAYLHASGGAPHAPCHQAVGDVVIDGEMREEGVLLKDQADAPLTGFEMEARRGVVEHRISQSNGASIWQRETGYQPEQGCLAGAARTDHGGDAGLERKIRVEHDAAYLFANLHAQRTGARARILHADHRMGTGNGIGRSAACLRAGDLPRHRGTTLNRSPAVERTHTSMTGLYRRVSPSAPESSCEGRTCTV